MYYTIIKYNDNVKIYNNKRLADYHLTKSIHCLFRKNVG